ncbi:MAG: PLP-dependent aminotransferase family protein [Chloroflexi bacterium]|nr:PLP-dependent aminotransferase family protein [Chloroflexota bacterium]
MHTVSHTYLLSIVPLDRESESPLYRQVYEGVRHAILSQQLKGGVRLPSTRDLADILSVSRNTVVNAIEQLQAEGYLESRVGAGTFVTSRLPDDLQYVAGAPVATTTYASGAPRRLSRLGIGYQRFLERRPVSYSEKPLRPFAPGAPDLNAFPFHIWARLIARYYQSLPLERFGYGQPGGGYYPLRQAIAEYLRASRAVRCEPEQIIIVAGSQAGIYLATRVLLNTDDQVWMENPGYGGAMGILRTVSAQLVPVPVDAEGLQVEVGIARAPNARLAYVTPSHQFPLGSTLSLPRRIQLIQWAERAGAWILEDDYDSEYRYSGHPLAALQGVDRSNRVIYIGTFSKVMFPALRLGYLVVPPDLVNVFEIARQVVDQFMPVVPQAALAEFIMEGHFSRHIRRMRKVYIEKRDTLLGEIARHIGDRMRPGPTDAGMHVSFTLEGIADDHIVTAQAARRGIVAPALSRFYLESETARQGLVLGFTGPSLDALQAGVRQLGAVLPEASRRA